jgi:hypothetical protein
MTFLNSFANIKYLYLDDNVFSRVEVLVDGAVVGQAAYGDVRPDVKEVLPKYNNGNAGFHFALNITQFTNGQHSITVRETGKNGQVTTLFDRTITIENAIGFMDNPVPGTIINGTKNVSGWFLDESGIARIEYWRTVQRQVKRPMVMRDQMSQKVLPPYKNEKAGFHYALDTTQFTDGQHIVTIIIILKPPNILMVCIQLLVSFTQGMAVLILVQWVEDIEKQT